jgi:hypothetical protein
MGGMESAEGVSFFYSSFYRSAEYMKKCVIDGGALRAAAENTDPIHLPAVWPVTWEINQFIFCQFQWPAKTEHGVLMNKQRLSVPAMRFMLGNFCLVTLCALHFF